MKIRHKNGQKETVSHTKEHVLRSTTSDYFFLKYVNLINTRIPSWVKTSAHKAENQAKLLIDYQLSHIG